VPINYNARLVMYLRDVGVITDAKAEEILSASAPNRLRRGNGDRRMLTQMWAVQGGLGAIAVIAGLGLQGWSGRLGGDPDQFAAETGAPVVPQRAGALRFVVDPWGARGDRRTRGPHDSFGRGDRAARGVATSCVSRTRSTRPSIARSGCARGETQVIEETLVELPATPEGEAP
jgi:hypothetical protein